jgi:hypothetical protein
MKSRQKKVQSWDDSRIRCHIASVLEPRRRSYAEIRRNEKWSLTLSYFLLVTRFFCVRMRFCFCSFPFRIRDFFLFCAETFKYISIFFLQTNSLFVPQNCLCCIYTSRQFSIYFLGVRFFFLSGKENQSKLLFNRKMAKRMAEWIAQWTKMYIIYGFSLELVRTLSCLCCRYSFKYSFATTQLTGLSAFKLLFTSHPVGNFHILNCILKLINDKCRFYRFTGKKFINLISLHVSARHFQYLTWVTEKLSVNLVLPLYAFSVLSFVRF